jgi:hypothetical protein
MNILGVEPKNSVSFKSVGRMVLITVRVDNYLYPLIPIFSRPARHRSRSGEAGGRCLLASREVAKYVGFR